MTASAATEDDVDDSPTAGDDHSADDVSDTSNGTDGNDDASAATAATNDVVAFASRFTDRDARRLGFGAVALFTGTALGVAFDAAVPGIALAALGALALASTFHARLEGNSTHVDD